MTSVSRAIFPLGSLAVITALRVLLTTEVWIVWVPIDDPAITTIEPTGCASGLLDVRVTVMF
jgi:hypothetical protein